MTRPSPELLAVGRRWIDSIPNRRVTELRSLLTDRDHLQFVGTGDDEIWTGGAVRAGVADFFGAIPIVTRHDETFAEAYENNDTGWACFVHQIVFANQPDRLFNVRTTLIFALEEGVWKIVHRHGSVPIPNMEMTGTEQTAIADLVAAAQEDFSLDQREGFASVMFTDIVNSSGLAATLGDRLWSSEIARHFASLQKIIENAGGQFVKSLGDGTMSSFPSPARALEAAQDIMRATDTSDGPAFALRIGIHSGNVVQTADDFFGTVVNKAARVAANAEPGDICVSETTRELAGDSDAFGFADTKIVHLRGLEGEHTVHRLEWRS